MKEKVNDLEDTLQSHLVLFERETPLKAAARRWRFLGGVGDGSVVLYEIWRDLCKSFLFSGKLAQNSPILITTFESNTFNNCSCQGDEMVV